MSHADPTPAVEMTTCVTGDDQNSNGHIGSSSSSSAGHVSHHDPAGSDGAVWCACKQVFAVAHCAECNDLLCKYCLATHRQNKFTKDHFTTPMVLPHHAIALAHNPGMCASDHVFTYEGVDKSDILTHPMELHLRAMFKHAPHHLWLAIAANGGIAAHDFNAAILALRLREPALTTVLVVLRATTGFVFGAVIYDAHTALALTESSGHWIAGHADNFLFNVHSGSRGLPSVTAPLKLQHDNPGATDGLLVSNAAHGLFVGGGNDLSTFHGDGTTYNYCNPSAFTTASHGYLMPAGGLNSKTLAGDNQWTPDRSEVYAVRF